MRASPMPPLVLFAAVGFVVTRTAGQPAAFPGGAPVKVTSWLLALVPVMFSYSGWNAAVYVAEEIRQPADLRARFGVEMAAMNHLLAKSLTDLNGTDPYIHGGVSGLGGRKTKKKGKVKDTAQKPEGRAIGKQKANAISLTCRVTREDIGFASSSSGWASKKDGFNGT